MKQKLRLTERELENLISESVKRVLNEAYSDAQYANLAGQANGALTSFGGRLKGLFNPKWKARKQRQMKDFANQATGNNNNPHSSTNDGENNYGRNKMIMPAHNYNDEDNGIIDYVANDFNKNNKKSPFELKRNTYAVSNVRDGKEFIGLSPNGETFTPNDLEDRQKFNFKRNPEMRKQFLDTVKGNSQLNNAFKQGKKARKKNATGTRSQYFKSLK